MPPWQLRIEGKHVSSVVWSLTTASNRFSLLLFLDTCYTSSNEATLRPWFDESDNEENNRRSKHAYEALLTVTARVPDTHEYAVFTNDVNQIARAEFNYSSAKGLVNPFVAAFHEALLLYAIALNETLQQNDTITNGAAITKRMWSRTFQGNLIKFLIVNNKEPRTDCLSVFLWIWSRC